MKMKPLKAKELYIGEYLVLDNKKESLLNIPFSQRPYVWGDKEILRFWEDLKKVYDKDEEEHILNFITQYGDSEGIDYIYDGQQRTITSVVLLCSIANTYMSLYNKNNIESFKESHNEIKSRYIINKNKFGVDNGTNIIINFYDDKLNDFFKAYIVNGEECNNDKKLKNQTNKNLYNTYKFFKNKIEEFISIYSNDEDKETALFELTQCFLKKFIIVQVNTKNKKVAEKMFNSLNTAGKGLEDFYILKNECVSLIGENNVKDKWMEIEISLEDLSKEQFINYYANVIYKKLSKNMDIIDKLKRDYIYDEQSTKEFLKSLWKTAKWYSFCKNSENDDLFENGEYDEKVINQIKHSIDILNKQQITSYIPVIFALALKGYKIDDIRDVFVEIENLMIRNKTILNHTAQKFNDIYTSLAYDILYKNIEIEEIKCRINEYKVDDDEIRDVLSRPFKKSSSTLRNLLKEIIDMESVEISTEENIESVNLEHIAPKTITTEWKKESGEDIEEYIYHIGNLTLISTSKNSKLKNKSFGEKKEVYKNSNIPMTRDIGESDFDKWTKKEILSRSNELCSLIIKRWPKN